MLTHHFAINCDDDAAGGLHAAESVGTDETLPAAEPVGIVGGHPVPAPAAAGEEPATDRIEVRGTGPTPVVSSTAMDRFAADYLQLLGGRLDAIRRCLDDSDVEGTRVAILSLESSSVMLGATALATRLTELRSELKLGPTPQRYALLSLVDMAAADFRRELESDHRA